MFISHQFGRFRGKNRRLKASIYVEKSSTLRLQRWQISVEHPCAYDWRHLGGQMGWETWVKDSSDFGEEYGIYFFQLDLKWEIPGLRESFLCQTDSIEGYDFIYRFKSSFKNFRSYQCLEPIHGIFVYINEQNEQIFEQIKSVIYNGVWRSRDPSADPKKRHPRSHKIWISLRPWPWKMVVIFWLYEAMAETHGEKMCRTYGRGFVVLLVVEVQPVCVFFWGWKLEMLLFCLLGGVVASNQALDFVWVGNEGFFPASVAPIYIIKLTSETDLFLQRFIFFLKQISNP